MHNIIKIIFILIFTYNCSSLTGINKEPKNQRTSKSTESNYTINDINLEIIDINELNETQLKKYNNSNINEVKYSVKQFSNIYNYKYEYVLGPSDVISINLTDTDDLDGAYTIDPKGNIDLPFVGTVNVLNLTLDNTKEKIVTVLKKYYKNYDLQITIDEFNSSKAYVLGAVKNQITIDLNQKPIKLIANIRFFLNSLNYSQLSLLEKV